MKQSDADRFWAKVNTAGECWVWTASVSAKRGGYGQFRIGGTVRRAHIVAYEVLVGLVPDGKQLDHLCRNTRCVRPDHLEPVTSKVNIGRSQAPTAVAHRTQTCLRGLHSLSGRNLMRVPSSSTGRCRECYNAGRRARAAV